MFKPEELLSPETWASVLSKLSTTDELSCRCVCVSFKNKVDSILMEQDRLWFRRRDEDYTHYFCYDTDHRISSRDTLYFGRTICIKNLKFVSKLMPFLNILQLDRLDPVYRKDYDEIDNNYYENEFPQYYDKNAEVIPITEIFPQVTCLILPRGTREQNFVGDLSQVKHLTLSDGVKFKSPTFPNLESLEVRKYSKDNWSHLPMPSKRFVVPYATLKWSTLPKTLEVIETRLNCKRYFSAGKPHFENLKVLKNYFAKCSGEDENLKALMNFLKYHKESLTELSFSAEKEVANIKDLVLLMTQLQKLSLEIKIDKQAIELKEIKALAHNLQYFELSFYLWLGTEEKLVSILENLPIGLDNLSIKIDGEINTFMEKIIEKVVNGDTKTVTIAGVYDDDADFIIDEFVKIKPSLVKVEKRNTRVLEGDHSDSDSEIEYSRSICDIVISL